MSETPAATPDIVEEREVKLAVDGDWALPSLADLDGVTAIDQREHLLRAVYLDTEALGLVRAGVGVRHRNGSWGYKGRSRREGDALVREEIEVVADVGSIPEVIRERLERLVDVASLQPVATLETMRRTVAVNGGGMDVELVHDHVRVIDDGRVVAAFAEVEVEFAPSAHHLAERVVALLVDSGAVVDTVPKYIRALRALGHHVPGAAL